MRKALITFADKSTLEIQEGQLLMPIVKQEIDNEVSAGQAKPREMYWHHNNGLIPDILGLLYSCDFFYVLDSQDKAYGASSVVSVENR